MLKHAAGAHLHCGASHGCRWLCYPFQRRIAFGLISDQI
jgi:hypothetical protein